MLAEAELLAQLTQHPAWPKFQDLLTEMRQNALEQLAVADGVDVPRWQGVATILQQIKDRPEQIVKTARTILDEEAQSRQQRTSLDFADGVRMEDDI